MKTDPAKTLATTPDSLARVAFDLTALIAAHTHPLTLEKKDTKEHIFELYSASYALVSGLASGEGKSGK